MRRWPWQKRTDRGSRRWLWLSIALFVLLTAVIGVFIAEPVIERVVESGLDTMPGGYHGSLEGVDLRPLSAEVALLGLKIEKQNGKVPVPYLYAKQLVIGTVRESFRLRSTMRVVDAVVNLVDGPSKALDQWGPKFDLHEVREKLPFELSRLDIENAQIHFRNFHAKPQVDVYLGDTNVTWDKLVGCVPDGSQACRSEISGDAKLNKSGRVKVTGTFARMPQPVTRARLELRDLKARELNPVLSEYAKVDMQGGLVEADARYVGRGEAHAFRITPRLTDLEIVGGEDKGTSFFREVGLGAAAGWFERKKGTKAISIESKGGKFDYSLVDLTKESADEGS